MDLYKDVQLSNMNPLIHFLRFGIKEKRLYRYARIDYDDLVGLDNKARIMDYYDVIYDSIEFDIDYYINENNITSLNNLDPIIHYIVYGVYLGYNPSNIFNTREYIKNIPYNKLTTNPLYHYIKYATTTTTEYLNKKHILLNAYNKYDVRSCKNILKTLKQKISIIIPIYNAYDETRNCIESVLLNTHINYELILINDASSDNRIKHLLDSMESIDFVKIIHNKENQGFIKNVNMGMKLAEGDVVLLNSDTIVTPKWLSQLVFSAYLNDKIATVTPFSNSSDISIEKLGTSTDRLFLNSNAYQLNKLSDTTYIQAPTGNGFCLFIKRSAIDDLGYFDEIFDKGYGEETDFTARARKNGWINLRNQTVFVYHRRHASFTSETANELKKKNKKILSKRYPQIYSDWDEFVKSPKIINQLKECDLLIKPYKKSQRILYVTTYNSDGTLDIDDVFYELARNYECYILAITLKEVSIHLYDGIGNFITIKKWSTKHIDDEEYFIRLYFNMFMNYKIDLVYMKNFTALHHPRTVNLTLFIKFFKSMEVNVLNDCIFLDKEKIIDMCEEKFNPDTSLNELINEKSNYINFDNKKVVVYTALTGHYDDLVTPEVVEDDFDYICFTDNPNLKSNFWEIRYMEELNLNEVRKARRYKILPHKYLDEYDYSIWIDTNFDIHDSLKDYVNKYSKNHKLLAIAHEQRDCIYDEAEKCIEIQKDLPEIINKQMDKYQKEGYPKHNGLVASGILFRNHHDKDVIKVMEDWYSEVVNYSFRDQLSFNYVCWKNNFVYDESDIFYFKNEYFQRLEHSSIVKINPIYTQKQVDNILEAITQTTTIIIPIYNAYDQLRECIESVKKYTKTPYELLLIDDCSSDRRIEKLLKSLEDEENITVIYNKHNMGFVKNVNIGFSKTSNDVVLLNSDTIVSNNWLEKMKSVAYTNSNIATVTPVSNNAGAFSVPNLNENNSIDERLGISGTANIIEKKSENKIITTPTGNGFCMFIKHEAIDDVGEFDLSYGRGYCEENDFCMRLIENGWQNVIDMSTYIFHNHNVSFGDEKNELLKINREHLGRKFPEYKARIDNFIELNEYKKIRDNIKLYLEHENNIQFNRKRILYVIHEGKGGTLYTSTDLMKHISKYMDVYMLTSNSKELKVYKYSSFEANDDVKEDYEFLSHFKPLYSFDIETEYTIKTPFIPEFNKFYFNILKMLHIDIIHVRHLIKHSLDIVYTAKKLGLPVIFSFHDFYYVCPSHNLIDNSKEYCGGHCSPIDMSAKNRQCSISTNYGIPLLKKYVGTWRAAMGDMFNYCDTFITTSPSAVDIYGEFYPEIKDNINIIEHGRDLKTPDTINVPKIVKNKPIKIVIPGNIGPSKGGVFIKNLKKYDVNNRLELHILGDVDGRLGLDEVCVLHGTYKRSEFCKLVHDINPHAMAIFSIWPETYCHTLSESWSCGLPVISIDIGAPGERIHRNGGGFLLSNNPKEAYDEIISIFDDEERYLRVANEVKDITFKTTKEMADEYMDIYKKFL